MMERTGLSPSGSITSKEVSTPRSALLLGEEGAVTSVVTRLYPGAMAVAPLYEGSRQRADVETCGLLHNLQIAKSTVKV
jgi:hypothetical protein